MDRFNGTHSHGAVSARACAARRWHAGADGGGRDLGAGTAGAAPGAPGGDRDTQRGEPAPPRSARGGTLARVGPQRLCSYPARTANPDLTHRAHSAGTGRGLHRVTPAQSRCDPSVPLLGPHRGPMASRSDSTVSAPTFRAAPAHHTPRRGCRMTGRSRPVGLKRRDPGGMGTSSVVSHGGEAGLTLVVQRFRSCWVVLGLRRWPVVNRIARRRW